MPRVLPVRACLLIEGKHEEPMALILQELLGRLAAGEDLSREQMAWAVEQIMAGRCTEGEIGLLLMGLRLKGETAAEVAGAAQAMRRFMVPLPVKRQGVLDTCGTGGDGSGTFNISTATALVVAACGVPVVKHGNRSVSSRSGSADVLEALGVRIDTPVEQTAQCLEELGICFCFAPLFHPAMKHVAPVRRKLGVPTIFNLLGPLCNPAGVQYQLLGVGRPELRVLLAQAAAELGGKRVVVVHGQGGLDEVSLSGTTWATVATPHGTQELCWTAKDFGLRPVSVEELQTQGPQQSAQRIEQVLRGEDRTGARDVVLANAAAALWCAGACATVEEGVHRAAEAVDRGAAWELLQRWIQATR